MRLSRFPAGVRPATLRGWHEFHNHAPLCIAAYGFLMARHPAREKPGCLKNLIEHQTLSVPPNYIRRGSAAQPMKRPSLDSNARVSAGPATHAPLNARG